MKVDVNETIKVKPGDKLVLKAQDGELYIDGVDDPILIELAQAVDTFLLAERLDETTAMIARNRLIQSARELPERVKKQILSGLL